MVKKNYYLSLASLICSSGFDLQMLSYRPVLPRELQYLISRDLVLVYSPVILKIEHPENWLDVWLVDFLAKKIYIFVKKINKFYL